MADHNATNRLHLITNPKRPDIFMGMSDAVDSDPAPIAYTPLAESRRNHPSNVDAPTAS